jgi:SAM-dependent methyltransferase
MILDEQIPELLNYKEYESSIVLQQCSAFASSVAFRGNDDVPVHSWFRFKEGFSAGLLQQLLSKLGYRTNAQLRILDPFCGVGTSLLSAQLLDGFRIEAVGIERNPFIAFVARTKLRWSGLRTESFLVEGRKAVAMSEVCHALPELSSIRTGRCISKHMAGRLLGICQALDPSWENYSFLKLGLAAAVEPLSKIRRDGRALRIVEKPYQRADQLLGTIWNSMARDVLALSGAPFKQKNRCSVLLGDGRVPSEYGIESESIDLVITSPPYPNNIDYSEVYKLELWLLGFVSSHSEFLALRHSTFRSHPTHNKTTLQPAEFIRELRLGSLRVPLGELLDRIETFEHGWRAKLLESYFSDCWKALANYYEALRPGGRAVFVVGNSLHGTDVPALVATDLILCKIGEVLGFEVENILVARGLRRRLSGNHFLRESIVVLRKSDAV